MGAPASKSVCRSARRVRCERGASTARSDRPGSRRRTLFCDEHLLDGARELIRDRILQHERRSSRLERFLPDNGIVGRGENDDCGLRSDLLDLTAGLESADLGHGDVEHDHIGLESRGCFEECGAIRHATDDLARGLEDAPQRGEEPFIIVRQQYREVVVLESCQMP